MRVLIVGQEEYPVWQQVYSLVRRLPEGLTIISDEKSRVGEMVMKAAKKEEGLTWESWYKSEAAKWGNYDFVITYWDPKDVFGTSYRYFVADLMDYEVHPFEITPDLYPEQATWAVEYITLWRNHGNGEGPASTGRDGIQSAPSPGSGVDRGDRERGDPGPGVAAVVEDHAASHPGS